MQAHNSKFGLLGLVNLICQSEVSFHGMAKLWMNVDVELWRRYIYKRIREVSKQAWKYGLNGTERAEIESGQ